MNKLLAVSVMESPYRQMLRGKLDMGNSIHINTRVINFVWEPVQGVYHGRLNLAH